MALLSVVDLKVEFKTLQGSCLALDKVTYGVQKGEIVAIVGESGCGKTISALSILRLIPSPPGRIIGGQVFFESEDLLKFNTTQLRSIRGNRISMIFQEPMSCLNPLFNIGDQISEPIMLHQGLNKRDATKRAVEMLDIVRMPAPSKRIKEYPHQLSGGMRQRVMIAMALSCNPSLLIADEPTTALDVTTQAQILDLLLQLQVQFQTSIILITHDLGVVAEIAKKVVVMYAGRVVEKGSIEDIFKRPEHPYTKGLLLSISYKKAKAENLPEIPGSVPNLYRLPQTCKFYPRCEKRMPRCKTEPTLVEIEKGHSVRCWLANDMMH
jgi:oligopeptide/dipeptide ABC transporter ATP-binding protein